MLKLLLIFFILLFSLFFSSSSSLNLSLTLNSTSVEWEEPVNASGYATIDGIPWQVNVSVRLNEKEVCFVQTNTNGFYSCSFSVDEIDDFSVVAYAVNGSTIVARSNEVLLHVIYFYGSKKETKRIASIEFPLIIQDLNGKIHKVKAYLKIWS
jgi:hypothetical protein